jgi:hypothetical protein
MIPRTLHRKNPALVAALATGNELRRVQLPSLGRPDYQYAREMVPQATQRRNDALAKFAMADEYCH